MFVNADRSSVKSIMQPQERCYYETVYETRIIATPSPHDGLVSTYSQQLDKSKGRDVRWANTSIKGVNHMEQRNHPNTKREFDAVLNGRTYRPDIFDKNR